jgi:heme A synthase
VSPLILAVTAGAWLVRRHERGVLVTATLVPLLLAVQIVLGRVVVELELPAMVVLVHLTFALVILGLLVWTAVAAGPRPVLRPGEAVVPRRFGTLVNVTLAATFVLLVVGAYVRATGAGYACIGFPDCNGQALPIGSNRLVDLHLTHRLLAYLVAGLIAAVLVQSWRLGSGQPAIRLVATALAVLALAQIVVGAVGVSTGLPVLIRGLHLAGAAAVWSAVVWLAALVARQPLPAPAADATTRAHPGTEIAHGAVLRGY